MANVTFLGAGLMGAALARAARDRGDRVVSWNRTSAKAKALETFGVSAVETVAEAIGGADRVHILLADDAAVDAVLSSCGDALRSRLVIDHSTTLPATTAVRASRLEAAGVAFLHAPVFMSPKMCLQAGGSMLCAGPVSVFERAEAELRKMTGALHYLGERRDLAAAQKLFGNAMIVSIVSGLADVYTLASALGITAEEAHALFGRFNTGGIIAGRGLEMAKGNFEPSFHLETARKDVRLMLEVAGSRDLAVLPAIARRMDALLERGLGDADVGILAGDAVPSPKGR